MEDYIIMGKNDVQTFLKWRKNNILRYELTLNKSTNEVAYNHLVKQTNKRDYLIKLIEEDAKREERLQKNRVRNR